MNLGYSQLFFRSLPHRLVRCACPFVLVTGFFQFLSGMEVNGNLDVSSAQTSSAFQTSSLLNQKYALHVQHRLTPYILAKSSLRYFHLGQDLSGIYSYRSEILPLGELSWQNPWFNMGIFSQKRLSANSNPQLDLTRDNNSFSLKSLDEKWPLLHLRYDYDRMYHPDDLSIQNREEDKILAGVSWKYRSQFFSYGGNQNRNKDLNKDNTFTSRHHNGKWDQQTGFLNDRLHLRTQYSLNYREDVFETADPSKSLQVAHIRNGFTSVDMTPEMGGGDTVNGLADGNLETPVSPRINLGQSSDNVNILLDFGNTDAIEVIHIYTSRTAEIPNDWAVYVSGEAFFHDEMEWKRLTTPLVSRYDNVLLRYEIEFPEVQTRFFKLVSLGVTDTALVEVTEIEAFQHADGSISTRRDAAQSVSMNSHYIITDKYDLSFDAAMQNDPLGLSEEKKKDLFFSISSRQQFNDYFSGVLRMNDEHMNWGQWDAHMESRMLNYTFRYHPRDDLSITLSSMKLWSYLRGRPGQENFNALTRLNAALIPALNMSTELGFNINEQFLTGKTYHTWNYLLSMDGEVTEDITLLSSYSYRISREQNSGESTERNQVGTNLIVRLTQTILARGQVDVIKDRSFYTSCSGQLSWRLTSRLQLGENSSLAYRGALLDWQRHSVYGNYKIGRRGDLYIRYNRNSFSGTEDQNNSTYQAGFKTGF